MTFKVDDYVRVLDTAKVKGVTKKLSNRYKGPYRVTLVIDDANFKVKTLNGKKQLMVNKARLKRCFPRRFLLELDVDGKETAHNKNNDMSITVTNTESKTGKKVSKENIKNKKNVTFKDDVEVVKPKKTKKAKKKAKNTTLTSDEDKTRTHDNLTTATSKDPIPDTVTHDGKRIRSKPNFFQAGSKK